MSMNILIILFLIRITEEYTLYRQYKQNQTSTVDKPTRWMSKQVLIYLIVCLSIIALATYVDMLFQK